MCKDKAIKAIKKIRQIEDKHYKKFEFCNEHKFTLEAEYHRKIINEVKEIGWALQDIFDVGYVSSDDEQ